METGEKAVGVGIAGLGRSGWDIHVGTLQRMAGRFRVVAAMDNSPSRLRDAAAIPHCRVTERFETLIQDPAVDLVVVATPSNLHAEQTIAALRAGKHVVCEKPMALSIDEADRMVAAADQSQRILSVFHNLRYAPDFVQIRRILDSGQLGRIVRIRITQHRFYRRWDWQTMRQYGGGSLNNSGAHYIDLGMELMGLDEGREPRVWAQMQRTLTPGDTEDHLHVILTAAGKPTLDVEISNACAYPQDTWHILGTAGGLHGNNDSLEWKWVDWAAMPAQPLDPQPAAEGREYPSETMPWQEESWKRTQSVAVSFERFYDDLYATLRHGAPLAITPRSIRRRMLVMTACRQTDTATAAP